MKKPHPWIFKLMVAFSKLTPNCPEVSRLSSASLDRPLTWRERIAMRAHFLICSWCRRYQQQLRFLRSAVRSVEQGGEAQPPHTLPPAARDKLKQRLKAESSK